VVTHTNSSDIAPPNPVASFNASTTLTLTTSLSSIVIGGPRLSGIRITSIVIRAHRDPEACSLEQSTAEENISTIES